MTQPTLPIIPMSSDSPRTAATPAERSRRYRQRKRDGRAVTAPSRDARAASRILGRQLEIRFDYNEAGDLLLIQESWPDDDAVIIVVRENIMIFIDRLCDLAGIGSAP